MTILTYTPKQWLGIIGMCVLAVLVYSYQRTHRAPFPHNAEIQRLVLSALAILLIEDQVFRSFVIERKADGVKADITAEFTRALQPYIRDRDREFYHWSPEGIITDKQGNPIVMYVSMYPNGKLHLDVMGRNQNTQQESLLLQLKPDVKSLTKSDETADAMRK